MRTFLSRVLIGAAAFVVGWGAGGVTIIVLASRNFRTVPFD